MTHSEMETLIEREGRAVVRSMVQSHLELRGLAEPEEPPHGVDDVARRNRAAGTSRPLVSLLGPVTAGRTRYEQHGVPGLHPVDAELNLLAEKYSLPVRKRVASMAAQSSLDATAEALATTTGARVPKRQVAQRVHRAAVDFTAWYADTELNTEPATTGDVLMLTFNGKGVVMRAQDLREAMRKAA